MELSRRQQRLAAVALVAAVLAGPGLALGQAGERGEAAAEGEAVALIALPGSQAGREVAEQLGQKLAAALPSSPAPPVAPAEASKALLERGGRQALKKAARLASEARRSLEAFDDLEATAKLLREAAEAHLDLLPLLDRLDEPVQLLVDLATVEMARGRQAQVVEALEAAARLDPTLDLDPQEVSPRLAQAAKEAARSSSTDPVLSPARVRSIGTTLSAATLLLVQPRPGPGQMLVERYQVATGDRQQAWTVTGSELAPVLAALLPGSQAGSAAQAGEDRTEPGTEGTEGAEARPEERRPERPARPWYRRWWVWTIVGAVVIAGGATGAVFGVRAYQEREDLPLEVHGHW